MKSYRLFIETTELFSDERSPMESPEGAEPKSTITVEVIERGALKYPIVRLMVADGEKSEAVHLYPAAAEAIGLALIRAADWQRTKRDERIEELEHSHRLTIENEENSYRCSCGLKFESFDTWSLHNSNSTKERR